MKNYYALLGVDRSATVTDIKKNYRKLAVRYHPDKSSDPDSSTKFIAITEAYDVLSNKKRRAAYDLYIWETLRRKRESREGFTAVVPPRQSTRTRRNKLQKQRAIFYHSANNSSKKLWLLIKESFIVISRYYLYFLGGTLALVIIKSLSNELGPALENGIVSGIMIGLFIAAAIYCLIKILQQFYSDIKKDIEALSVFYKISSGKASGAILSALTVILVGYIILLIVSF